MLDRELRWESIRPLIRLFMLVANGALGGFLLIGVLQLGLSYAVPLHPAPVNGDQLDLPTANQESPQKLPSVNELSFVQKNKISSGETRSDTESQSDTESESQLGNVDMGSVEKVQESSLPLEVVGISYGPIGFRSVTLRNLKDRKVQTLFRGDRWSNARIEQIRSDEVLLRNTKADRTEILPLERGPGLSKESSSSSDRSQSISRYKVNETIQSNMDNLLADVEVKPAFDQGKILGFRIEGFKGRAGELLEKLGFQPGDVITRVNGKSIDGMDQALKLWSSLKYQKNFDIQVLRNGEKKNFEYQLTR